MIAENAFILRIIVANFLKYKRHINQFCHIIVIIKLNNKGILLSSFTSE